MAYHFRYEDNDNIKELQEKVNAMRQLLVEWNPTSEEVWEHPLMEEVGETASDYPEDDEDDDDLEDDVDY